MNKYGKDKFSFKIGPGRERPGSIGPALRAGRILEAPIGASDPGCQAPPGLKYIIMITVYLIPAAVLPPRVFVSEGLRPSPLKKRMDSY